MAAAPPFARSALQSWGLCMPCWADQVGWFRPKSCDIRFAACKMPPQCAACRHCSMLSQDVGRSWSRGEGVKSPRGPACLSSGFPGRPGAGRDCRGTAMPSGPSASTLCDCVASFGSNVGSRVRSPRLTDWIVIASLGKNLCLHSMAEYRETWSVS